MNWSIKLSIGILACSCLNPVLAQPGDMLPRSLLVDMARSQYSLLCSSETFTTCMGFPSDVCSKLADDAIEQCLLPLPEAIDPKELDNSALESCPVGIFADAGFSEEKAGVCFTEAMEAEGS